MSRRIAGRTFDVRFNDLAERSRKIVATDWSRVDILDREKVS